MRLTRLFFATLLCLWVNVANAANPSLTSPITGNTFTGSTQTFTWNAQGNVVTNWVLYIGSAVGKYDYYNSNALAAAVTSKTVTTLPVNAHKAFVRLRYKIGTTWGFQDYTFYMAGTNHLPTISGTPASSVKVGEAYAFTPTVTDMDGEAKTFSILNKPKWALFSAATGKLTGTPTAAHLGKTDNITIKVKDERGGMATLSAFSIAVLDPFSSLTLDTDGDGMPNTTDTDDDNDGVLDNDDFRPLDRTIQVMPSYTGRVSSYAQTYVRADSPTSNYNSNAYLQTRSLAGAYATAGLLYFDIPSTLNGKRADNISKATLTLKSDTEKDTVKLYASSNTAFPTAASATWNNAQALFGKSLYGQVAMKAGTAASAVLSPKVAAGKIVFVVDETGDDAREKLIKSNAETYLDLEFNEVDPVIVSITPVADSLATQAGGELRYQVQLTQAPTSDVYVPLALQDTTTATLTSAQRLVFTPSNYSTAQTIVIKGKDDGSNQGTKANQLLVAPLLSEDSYYNGNNPTDWDFKVYAALPTAQSGQAYSVKADYTGTNPQFDLVGAPIGMSINAKTGVITWQPDSSEVGSYDFSITAKENGTLVYNKTVNLRVALVGANPTNAFYVVPNAQITNPVGTLGTIGNPYTNIETALAAASLNASKRTVYVRGGRYDNTAVTIGNMMGTAGNQVVLSKLPGERVKFIFTGLSAFDIQETAAHIVIDGFEVDGKAINDHWDMLANHWWDPKGDRTIGGGQAFNVDGQYITIRNNVIHDAYQKAVNIYKGRYVNVLNNVVYDIGHSSLSGGHAIMRKWERNFHIKPTDGKDLGVDVYNDADYQYRFDITGNLVLRVEQRIYSRVFNKGYSNLTIDEGKPISIDETQDTDPKSRISNNLVLYGGIDHIRLKQNPNMVVNNNSILADLNRPDVMPDGITDKSRLSNLKFYGNMVGSKGIAVELDDSFMTNGVDDDPTQLRKYGNYIGGGGTITGNLAGITNLGANVSSLFTDVANNDFHAAVSDNRTAVGVGDAYLSQMFGLVNEYAIAVTPGGWQHDHLKNAQYIVANIPKTVFSRATYYIGASTIETGHQALYIKFIDTDGQWLYTKREVNGAAWNALSNKDLIDPTIYDLASVAIQKCDTCKGAYAFQLVLPQQWFDYYGNAAHTPFTITNSDGTISNVVYLDPTHNPEHKNILDYAVKGIVRSY